jgi:hypothetical protein
MPPPGWYPYLLSLILKVAQINEQMQHFNEQWPKTKALDEEMKSSTAEVNKIENRHK